MSTNSRARNIERHFRPISNRIFSLSDCEAHTSATSTHVSLKNGSMRCTPFPKRSDEANKKKTTLGRRNEFKWRSLSVGPVTQFSYRPYRYKRYCSVAHDGADILLYIQATVQNRHSNRPSCFSVRQCLMASACSHHCMYYINDWTGIEMRLHAI